MGKKGISQAGIACCQKEYLKIKLFCAACKNESIDFKGFLFLTDLTKLRLPAYGKINISLDITGLRPNGYHELSSVMQSIQLADWLTFKINDTGEVRLSSQSISLPLGDDNLIVRAARLLQEQLCPKKGVEIGLEKILPIGAGLGGGSSDAAVTMRALNYLWGLGLTTSTLIALGVQLGADIPFNLIGGTAWARGVGEKLTILPPAPKMPLVLVKPPISLSAGEVYQYWDQKFTVSGQYTTEVLEALEKGDKTQLALSMGNDLEKAVIELAPQVGGIISKMQAFGVAKAMVSGSGPTVIGIVKDKQQGIILTNYFLNHYEEVYLTNTI